MTDDIWERGEWRWPSIVPLGIRDDLIGELRSPPEGAFQFVAEHCWLGLVSGVADAQSWVSIPVYGRVWNGDRDERGSINVVFFGHRAVQQFLRRLLEAAERDDLAPLVEERWRSVGPRPEERPWTESAGFVPNGLSWSVDVMSSRHGDVWSGDVTVFVIGRFVISDLSEMSTVPPLTDPAFRCPGNVGGLGMSVSIRKAVWVGLDEQSETWGSNETRVDVDELNLVVEMSFVAGLLRATGQSDLQQLLLEDSGREWRLRTGGHDDAPRLGSMTADSAPSVANHREPADERMLGVDDLVNAIIELNTSTSFDIKEYLRARIELLRLELGAVDGELRHFDAIFEDSLFNGIVGDPFTSDRVIQIPGLEAPWWLADPLNAMRGRLDEIIRRAHELNNAVVEVRKDWIRAALVSAEPALEHRRTTERRLEQRGLGERPRIVNQDFDWDDY